MKSVRHTITCSGPCSASLTIELQGKHGVADTGVLVREIAERAGWYLDAFEQDLCPMHGAGLVLPRKP